MDAHDDSLLVVQPRSGWWLYISNGFCIQVRNPPSAFQRRMQELILGFKWVHKPTGNTK